MFLFCFCFCARICISDFRSHKGYENNPNCVYGLGEHKQGIWKDSASKIAGLGTDPSNLLRDELTPIGLSNYGATCYLNSLLQCLFHIRPFRALVFAWGDTPVQKSAAQAAAQHHSHMLRALRQLFGQMQNSIKAIVGPRPLIQALSLSETVQQDAHEFFKLFITLLGDIFAKHPCESIHSGLPRMFNGQLQYVTQCEACGYQSVNQSNYADLVRVTCHTKLILLMKLRYIASVCVGAASSWL